MKKILFRWLKIIILVYCLIGIGLYYFQDKILFKPQAIPADSTYSFSTPYKEVNLPWSETSTINIIQFKPADSTKIKGVVLYFHGNRRNIGHYASHAPDFTKHQYEVWMIDYPGYGKSTGEFTEQALYDWSLVFYKMARARYSPDSIILYGKSMGTGIVSQLATIRDCKALILETPYYSFPSILGNYAPIYPVDRMVHFKIPTWKYIEKVSAPIVIFHGTDDGIIPLRNCKRLIPYIKKTDELVIVKGGSHNDLPDYPLYQQKIDSLLR